MNTQLKKNSLKPKSAATITKKPVLSGHRFQILTRHPSYSELRKRLPRMPFSVISRFGSTTVVENVVSKGGKTIEINEIKAIRNSSSKLLMKKCFAQAGVATANWWTYKNNEFCISDDKNITKLDKMPFPLIIKNIFGSRGTGNHFIENVNQLKSFCANHNMTEYIIEEYMSYSREYRLHINALDGTCFYTCRKMIKNDTPDNERYQRHDDNCVWYIDTNPKFDKPTNWNKVVEQGVKALKSIGLSIGAIDLKIQSAKDKNGKERKDPAFIVIETCSAPSMGDITTERYSTELPKVAYRLAKQLGIHK